MNGAIIRHEKSVRHPLLEMPNDMGLAPRDGNGQRLTLGSPNAVFEAHVAAA
jgi:hypothetical protein